MFKKCLRKRSGILTKLSAETSGDNEASGFSARLQPGLSVSEPEADFSAEASTLNVQLSTASLADWEESIMSMNLRR